MGRRPDIEPLQKGTDAKSNGSFYADRQFSNMIFLFVLLCYFSCTGERYP